MLKKLYDWVTGHRIGPAKNVARVNVRPPDGTPPGSIASPKQPVKVTWSNGPSFSKEINGTTQGTGEG